jgi:hypothetical protein
VQLARSCSPDIQIIGDEAFSLEVGLTFKLRAMLKPFTAELAANAICNWRSYHATPVGASPFFLLHVLVVPLREGLPPQCVLVGTRPISGICSTPYNLGGLPLRRGRVKLRNTCHRSRHIIYTSTTHN